MSTHKTEHHQLSEYFEDPVMNAEAQTIRSRLYSLLQSTSTGVANAVQGFADFSRDATERMQNILEPTSEAAESLAISSQHIGNTLESMGLVAHNLCMSIWRSAYSLFNGKRL